MNFLLEIGTEEIPHWMIPGALKQLSSMNLFGAEVHVDATPRRLVVRGSGLPERTPDQEQVLKGPPVSAGERAAAGFAKKQGVDPSALQKSGDYFELRKVVPGRSAIDILAETLPGEILNIQWPKTMYWTGKGGPRFIRPIRWIVALLDDQVIPFEIAGVKSGNVTRGHRQLGSSSIPVTIASYESELRKNFVILSAQERRKKIEKEAAALGAKLDADLVETLTYITEYPTAIRGEFDPTYLALPAEVLTTVMRHHQKYFSVEAGPGCLAPNFVAVMNTSGDPEGLVQRGNERVLRARFNDARFFWDMDQAKTLEERLPDLAKVTFQAKLGSYLEKTNRVIALVKELRGSKETERAALLCKCDLTTEMVKEFTDLQGVVGGLYAKAQGEPEAVGRAIYEHYQPLSMEDSIPETAEGQILALADKLETLRECFRIGLVPTGSKDPFALRRAAQGVVKILAEAGLDYKLDDLAGGELRAFLIERIQYYFREVRGFKYDGVNAVLKADAGIVLKNVEERIQFIEKQPRRDLEELAVHFKRIKNILRQANFTRGVLDVGMLEAGPERELYDAYKERGSNLENFTTLGPFLNKYFDKVMVNVPDEVVRTNRLSMLSDIRKKYSTVADFSEIVTPGEQK